MRLSLNQTGLHALDALRGIDALCLFIAQDERPLRGLAGFFDWRLCGSLSNVLRAEHFVGALGVPMLFPIARDLPVRRAFCFGLGERSAFQPELVLGPLLRQAMSVLSKAGCRSAALELPGLTDANAERLIEIFLDEGMPAFKGDALVLLSDEPKDLSRAFQKSGERLRRLQIEIDDKAAHSLVELKKSVSR
ncbi:MAG: peptidase M17 [Myxococcales bacterium]|jgi:hypothetical protein|nr:peptidase M17 [Myxococcales bacterium]